MRVFFGRRGGPGAGRTVDGGAAGSGGSGWEERVDTARDGGRKTTTRGVDWFRMD